MHLNARTMPECSSECFCNLSSALKHLLHCVQQKAATFAATDSRLLLVVVTALLDSGVFVAVRLYAPVEGTEYFLQFNRIPSDVVDSIGLMAA